MTNSEYKFFLFFIHFFFHHIGLTNQTVHKKRKLPHGTTEYKKGNIFKYIQFSKELKSTANVYLQNPTQKRKQAQTVLTNKQFGFFMLLTFIHLYSLVLHSALLFSVRFIADWNSNLALDVLSLAIDYEEQRRINSYTPEIKRLRRKGKEMSDIQSTLFFFEHQTFSIGI